MLKAATRIGFLEADVQAFRCAPEEFDDEAERICGRRLLSEEFPGKRPGAAQFQLASDDTDLCLVWLPESGADAGMLAHECVHAVVEILKSRRVPVAPEGNSEILAYMVGFLMRELAVVLEPAPGPEHKTARKRGRRSKK